MAAPVSHIVCALVALNSGTIDVADRNAFLVGTSFPDIRYISHIPRSKTHGTYGASLNDVKSAPSAFEAGRLFHIYVDRKREEHMRKHDAYRFVKKGPFQRHMLKIIEDHILFEKLQGQFISEEVFAQIYPEEMQFDIDESVIYAWHSLLKNYLSQNYFFRFARYFSTLYRFQEAYGMTDMGFASMWWTLRTVGFFIYAYIQVEVLSNNSELKHIILDFYENEIKELTPPPVDDNLSMVERPKDGMKPLSYPWLPSWLQLFRPNPVSLSERLSTPSLFLWQRSSSKTI